jgi:predicted secreted hydrolase
MKKKLAARISLIALLLSGAGQAALLGADAAAKAPSYRAALPGYRYEFPRDHFNHPEFQTEWWYYTGNLKSADGRRFGFELTFFRQGVSRTTDAENVWDTGDAWLAHLALSDVGGNRFLHAERLNRTGAGIAGSDEKLARVWNGNWQVQWALDPKQAAGGTQALRAVDERFQLDLQLASPKQPVIHGRNGVSQKAEGEGKASHYISLTRLLTKGKIVMDGKTYTVEGTSWMDHEFFSHQLEANQTGWDWFSLQLEDQAELMLFRLRRKDGTMDPYSAGTYVDAQGRSTLLKLSDFTATPQGAIWTSPATQGKYPIEWRVQVPSLGLDVGLKTPLASQEITGKNRNSASYWEGAIDVEGTSRGKAIRGVGYLEMTGYSGRVVGLD